MAASTSQITPEQIQARRWKYRLLASSVIGAAATQSDAVQYVPVFIAKHILSEVSSYGFDVLKWAGQKSFGIFEQFATAGINVTNTVEAAAVGIAAYVVLDTLRNLPFRLPRYFPRLGLKSQLVLLTAAGVGIYASGAGPFALEQAKSAAKGLYSIYENWDSIAPLAKGAISAGASYIALTAFQAAADVVTQVKNGVEHTNTYLRKYAPPLVLTERKLHYGTTLAVGLICGYTNFPLPSVMGDLGVALLGPGVMMFASEKGVLTHVRQFPNKLKDAVDYSILHHRRVALYVAGASAAALAVPALIGLDPFILPKLTAFALNAISPAAATFTIGAAVRGYNGEAATKTANLIGAYADYARSLVGIKKKSAPESVSTKPTTPKQNVAGLG